MFCGIEDTNAAVHEIGSTLSGGGEVARNQAVRASLAEGLATKAAEMAAGSAVPKPKPKPNKGGKKEPSEEQKARKKFDKDLEKPFGPGLFFMFRPRIQALASKARSASLQLTESGIMHQEAPIKLSSMLGLQALIGSLKALHEQTLGIYNAWGPRDYIYSCLLSI